MNNKGFTLIELLISVLIIGLISIIAFNLVGDTLALSKDNAYDVMKNNIVNVTSDYILECDNGLINCENDFVNGDEFSFKVGVLKKYGYFESLENPINGNDISSCMIVLVNRGDNGTLDISLDDSGC